MNFSFPQLFSSYLSLQVLLILAFLMLSMFSVLVTRLHLRWGSQSELNLHYFVLTSVLGLTVLQVFIPAPSIFEPVARVWSASTIKNFDQEFLVQSQKSTFVSFGNLKNLGVLDTEKMASSAAALLLSILISAISFFTRELWRLSRLRQGSYLIRRLGRVHIYVCDRIQVPFSFRSFSAANVLLPSSLVQQKEAYQIAIWHELQHHRNGDTVWIYILWAFKFLCPLNPAIYFWNRWVTETQEFACDENLVDHKKVDSRVYASCLLEVAKSALCQRSQPVCATGLSFLVKGNLLKRRIEKMSIQKIKNKKAFSQFLVKLGFVSLLASTAFAAKNLVQDRRISMAKAQEMAKSVPANQEFPIVINDLVLKQLNRFIGTPEGREYMRNSLQRMENYRSAIDGKIQEYNVPEELIAIPIIESGYQNLEERNQHGWGAGLWMFIKSTARVYGLKINDQIDQRLNVDLETDAAMRYLKSNYLRFKDWHLAILAYNVGENSVRQAMDKTGYQDAWSLIRNGYENDRDYLPKVMAAILIKNNPESIQ